MPLLSLAINYFCFGSTTLGTHHPILKSGNPFWLWHLPVSGQWLQRFSNLLLFLFINVCLTVLLKLLFFLHVSNNTVWEKVGCMYQILKPLQFFFSHWAFIFLCVMAEKSYHLNLIKYMSLLNTDFVKQVSKLLELLAVTWANMLNLVYKFGLIQCYILSYLFQNHYNSFPHTLSHFNWCKLTVLLFLVAGGWYINNHSSTGLFWDLIIIISLVVMKNN